MHVTRVNYKCELQVWITSVNYKCELQVWITSEKKLAQFEKKIFYLEQQKMKKNWSILNVT